VKCVICQIKLDDFSGVKCGNFGLRKHGRNWCNNAWHGKCYVKHSADDFPVLGQRDLDASLIDEAFLEEDDPMRFQEGREGDHLMCPFQCEECHFINIKGCFPEKNNAEDELLLSCMRRANLDAFWSREQSTVYYNMLEGRRFLANQKLLGIASASLPPRGPFPKKDIMGMGVAAGFLLRSFDKGQNANTLQYETVRKVRSFSQTTPTRVWEAWARLSPATTGREDECQIPRRIICGFSASHRVAIDKWVTCGCPTERSADTS
jgi:hypothetical protein